MKVVQIYKNGDMGSIDCKFTKKNIIKTLTTNSKSRGNDSMKLLYIWSIGQTELLCYGWYDGEAGFENKHDLPPSGSSTFIDSDSSEQLLFGDIFVVKRIKEKYCHICISEYSDYYNSLFGGFDECRSDDDGELSSEEEDIDYNPEIETSETEEEDEELSDNENELEEDMTDY